MKEYKVPTKKQPIFNIFKPILARIFCPKIDLIVLPNTIEEKSILIGNHSKKVGPFAYEVKLPVFTVKWGAHEMLGNYISRRNYLMNIFYIKKQGWSKSRAAFVSSIEAIFSKMMYKGIKLIPTYPDSRLKITLKNSTKVLEDNKAILIFPEDSNEGYFEVMDSFFPGFVMLSEYYFKKHQEDLPIYPVYYGRKAKRMIIGHPIHLQELIKKGMNRTQICDYCKDAVNNLYFNYIRKEYS